MLSTLSHSRRTRQVIEKAQELAVQSQDLMLEPEHFLLAIAAQNPDVEIVGRPPRDPSRCGCVTECEVGKPHGDGRFNGPFTWERDHRPDLVPCLFPYVIGASVPDRPMVHFGVHRFSHTVVFRMMDDRKNGLQFEIAPPPAYPTNGRVVLGRLTKQHPELWHRLKVHPFLVVEIGDWKENTGIAAGGVWC